MRVYCLHNGNVQAGKEVSRFVNKEGVLCASSEEYVWYKNMGVFKTKGDAGRWAKEHSVKLDVHSVTVHSAWMYDSFMHDLVK